MICCDESCTNGDCLTSCTNRLEPLEGHLRAVRLYNTFMPTVNMVAVVPIVQLALLAEGHIWYYTYVLCTRSPSHSQLLIVIHQIEMRNFPPLRRDEKADAEGAVISIGRRRDRSSLRWWRPRLRVELKMPHKNGGC